MTLLVRTSVLGLFRDKTTVHGSQLFAVISEKSILQQEARPFVSYVLKTATWSSEISCPAEPSGHGIKDFDAICLVVHRINDDEMMMLRIGECLTEIFRLLQNFGKQETCKKISLKVNPYNVFS